MFKSRKTKKHEELMTTYVETIRNTLEIIRNKSLSFQCNEQIKSKKKS